MSNVLEFLEFVEGQAEQSTESLLYRVLLKCRQLLNAEAGTIYLIEQADDGSPHARPICVQNDAVDMSQVDLSLAVDTNSIAGYVANTGETALIDNAYDLPQECPFHFNNSIDLATGYQTVSILAFPLKTFGEAVVGVVQLINRRCPGSNEPVAFDVEQMDLIDAVNKFIGQVIQRTVLLDESRNANCQLSKKNAELLAEVNRRKRAEAALQIAKNKAEQSYREKSEFLANVSHEIRTPLNSIMGFSEILSSEHFGPLGSPRYRDYASGIITSSKLLLKIIEDILEMAKIEGGRVKLDEATVRVDDVIEDTMAIMKLDAEKAEVQLVIAIPGELPELTADDRMVRQILVNMLSNAVKFSPRQAQIIVRAGVDSSGDFYLSVQDFGKGIPHTHISGAMVPFGQAETAHSGTGLGLPLVRSMAELHGGRLELRSKPHKGTVVTVYFPAVRVGRKNCAG